MDEATDEASPPRETTALVPNGKPRSTVLLVNVGGRRAKLSTELLNSRLDTSRLAMFAAKTHVERLTECDAYMDTTKEYYFERSPLIFECVVDFYSTGRLHRPLDLCPMRLRHELDFWRIPCSAIAACCRLDENNNGHMAKFSQQEQWDRSSVVDPSIYLDASCPPSSFDKVCWGSQRQKAWSFLENPRSSSGAKAFSIVSASFVLVSLSNLILSSMPELQDEEGEPHWGLLWLEAGCMCYFTLEYIVRFLVNPHKCQFVKSPLNVIDICTITPFIIELFLPLLDLKWMKNFRGAMLVIRVLRLARVARIFKLARYSTGLRAFGETMKKSAAELSMLGMFLVTGILLFSTAIYFFERDEPHSKFYSIPASCWWCVITMTTVGYGDLVPITTGGKVVAAIASVCGIIVLAFPISMIIDKFAESTGGTWFIDEATGVPTNAPTGRARKKHSMAGGALTNNHVEP